MPTTYGRATPVTFGSVGIRRRSRESGPRAMPNNASPITMINTPPTVRTQPSNVDSEEPRAPAIAPRPANTVVKPGDEDERRGYRARGIVRVSHLAHDDPEVRRNERDDARREERRDARAEQRHDLGEHALPNRT